MWGRGARVLYRADHPYGVGAGPDLVHAHRPGARLGGQGGDGGGGRVALAGGRGRGVGARQHPAEEPLAGRGDEQGVAEAQQAVEAGEQREVVVGVLGEAEAGVDDHAVGGDAALQDGLHARVELVGDLGDHVVVHTPDVAALQVAAPVHDDERGARGDDDPDHRGVGEAAADVVDQGGSGRERLLGDGGAHGVDGDGDALRREAPDHRDDAPELLGLVDAGGAGAGGLAADVHQVRALCDQVQAVLDGRGGVEPASAVGEGVGGDVHDPHDRAPVPVGEARDLTASASSAHMFSVGPGRGRGAARARRAGNAVGGHWRRLSGRIAVRGRAEDRGERERRGNGVPAGRGEADRKGRGGRAPAAYSEGGRGPGRAVGGASGASARGVRRGDGGVANRNAAGASCAPTGPHYGS